MFNPVRRFAFGVVLGLFVFEVSLRVISPLLGPPLVSWNTMQDAKLYKLQQLDAAQTPDIFVLGNSTALMGVSPTVLREFKPDLEVFNFAMNGSDSLSMVRLSIDELIPRYKVKKLILFFSQGSFREDLDFSNHPYELAQPKDKQNDFLDLVISEIYIYQYRNMIRDPMVLNSLIRSILFFSNNQGIAARWASDLDDSGYSILPLPDNEITEGWDKRLQNHSTTPEIVLPKGTVADLEYLAEIAKSRSISITLATVPTTSYDQNYRSTVEQLAQLYDFNFIQGNDAVTNGEFFQDGVHLNSKGARAFSMWLTSKI